MLVSEMWQGWLETFTTVVCQLHRRQHRAQERQSRSAQVIARPVRVHARAALASMAPHGSAVAESVVPDRTVWVDRLARGTYLRGSAPPDPVRAPRRQRPGAARPAQRCTCCAHGELAWLLLGGHEKGVRVGPRMVSNLPCLDHSKVIYDFPGWTITVHDM